MLCSPSPTAGSACLPRLTPTCLAQGAGVYFATVPQKSYNYTGSGGWILICNVGNSRKVTRARFIDPDKDLAGRSWIFWTKCSYDSVYAPAGNSTVSDEHIVYDVDQIYPVYLISVKRV